MADSEAPGDHLLDDPVEPHQGLPHEGTAPLDVQPVTDGSVTDDDRFDAFDATTWHFGPAPVPWHRTRPAVLGLVAVGVAAVALVVSVVLLASRSDDEVPARPSSSTPAPPSASTASATSSPPPETTSTTNPPAEPPPPPAPVSAPAPPSPVSTAPSDVRAPKKPELNVTRAPMSVSPRQRGSTP